MNVWQTSTKRVALVLVAAAVVAPAALGNSGQPVAGNSHLAVTHRDGEELPGPGKHDPRP